MYLGATEFFRQGFAAAKAVMTINLHETNVSGIRRRGGVRHLMEVRAWEWLRCGLEAVNVVGMGDLYSFQVA